MVVSERKVILVTGGNSGLGLQCCIKLAKIDNVHVVLTGRNEQRVQAAVDKVRETADSSSVVEAGIVDLSSLASVREYCSSLLTRDLKFFSIVCNAGAYPSEKRLTVDGFESAFGTNHLGHFLLVSLLRERVTQRVVVLSSEMHDSSETPGMPPPDVSDLEAVATGLEPFDATVTYSNSKLCNLLFVKEFERRFSSGPEVVAFTPGLTPDTGLFREQNPWLWPVMTFFMRIIMWWTGGRMSTSEYSGRMLSKLALEQPMPFKAKNGDYIRVDEVYEASATAKDPEIGRLLWDKSEAWVKK